VGAVESFSEAADGDHVVPVLRAASRVSGPASENRCSGRAILPIQQLLR
jgi:hypothetical protein